MRDMSITVVSLYIAGNTPILVHLEKAPAMENYLQINPTTLSSDTTRSTCS